jgi:predicted dehydrogenase
MIRVGISGCGAVAQRYYGPALHLLQGQAELVAAFDVDPEASRTFASPFGAKVGADFDDLLNIGPDLLIVASPPAFHADQSCSALEAGIRVLCEKPMALSVRNAERMVRTARDSRSTLAIGMVRRLLPQARLLKSLLSRQLVGELRTISIFEGGPFDWPIASPAYFDPAQGGGVLEDIGVHVVDLLRWWCGEPDRIAYSDDAMGGVAANCLLDLEIGATRVSARLSRDWHQPNLYRFVGEKGELEWAIHGTDEVTAVLDGQPIKFAPQAAGDYARAIAEQIRAVAAGRPLVSAVDGLETLRLLKRCQQGRRTMAMDWL